jgi:hypothetical protein
LTGFMSILRKSFFSGLLVAGCALAQISDGEFRGEVRDASNAVVPQAEKPGFKTEVFGPVILPLRAEFFNTLNHTNFGLRVNSIDSPSFGTITAAASARVIQVAVRLDF